MRTLFLLLLVALPALAEPIGYDGARHLLSRTGFGVTDPEVRALSGLTRAEAVDRILGETRREAVQPPPAFMSIAAIPYESVRALTVEERLAWQRGNLEQGMQLREWWLREMLETPSPLTERMTLFWHNHFATSAQKVRIAHLLYRQNVLLRREALGNFGALLHGVTHDPAMLIYLDNAQSRRGAPNENFAREVMELFTLGEGRYSEQDIKEAARAFTGLSVDRQTLEYRFRPFFHDGGEKTLFGKSGRFTAAQALDLMLSRPEVSSFIAAKLWKELVSPTPERSELARAAQAFRDARYEVKPLLRSLLLSDTFWAKENRGSLIRSPVELVVGTMRTFDIRPPSLGPAAFASALLGQNLLAPPNVKGWPGGEEWINSTTLLGRKQFVERVFRADDRMTQRPSLPRASVSEWEGAGGGSGGAAMKGDARMAQVLPLPWEGAGGGSGDVAMKGDPLPGTLPLRDRSPRERENAMQRRMERGLAAYAVNAGGSAAAKVEHPHRLLLPVAAVNPPAEGLGHGDLVRHLVADAAYQLK